MSHQQNGPDRAAGPLQNGVSNREQHSTLHRLPIGHRNDGLTRTAGHLRRKGWERPAIEAELLRHNLRRCDPPLPEDEVRTIAKSISEKPPGGPDPLEQAWRSIQTETHARSRYEQFVALVWELQRNRPEQPIALPLERIAELMECDWTSVRGYRRDAERRGLIYNVAPAVAHRRSALYRVSVEVQKDSHYSHYSHYWFSGNPHSGNSVVSHSGNSEVHEGAASETIDSHSGNERAEQVVWLASRGFCIFPVTPRAKKPPLVAWTREATSDVYQIEQWLRKFPDCNWGIATGGVSNIFVLDIDGAEGLQSFVDLCADAGADWKLIAETLGVKTGKGSHLYFKHETPIRNSASKLAVGLDIRSTGGYVIAPPSVHENDELYFWLGGDEKKPVASAPDWLVEKLAGRGKLDACAYA
jgi:hypothetical protein